MRRISFILVLLLASCKNERQSEEMTQDKDEFVQTTDREGINLQSTDLEVYDYEGLKKYLSTSTNKTYVVNFWATWCAPCVKELPYFEQLNSRYSDRNVEVILVSLDFPTKFESHLKPFIKAKKLESKIIALNDTDSNAWIPKVSENWSGAIPATLIFNKDKRQFYEKSFTYDELETEVKQFLK